ncbi:MAG: hypothetical protein AUK46_10155 [Flavobacteriaceae bacterium CG2_30_31_66]|nr:MAG: hypothetical protein AUK46_10155 [Flavobacteriaceae bacterium CG2_30_31_66]
MVVGHKIQITKKQIRMKNIQKLLKIFFILLLVACTENDLRDTSFADGIAAPTNVSAIYNITQDNSGSVTITPNADGAVSYEVSFGDGTATPAIVSQGESAKHIYGEGTYDIKVVALNLNGVKTEVSQQLIVSFKAPQNLVVVIENDAAISKKVNITANADFATMFEFSSGETGVTQPVVSGNIGQTISYTYQNPGTYNVSVVAKGGAIQTTKFDISFTVTEILAPVVAATTPPSRDAIDVISIFSGAYTNVAGSEFFPDWGQSTLYNAYNLNGDEIIQYSNLNYQGINIGATQNLSSMEFLHMDVWTADAAFLDTYLISAGSGEKFIKKTLTKDNWTTIDIPIKDFTDQGLSVNDIYQFKFVGSGTVFIDNIYFYKSPTSPVSNMQDFESAAPTFTVFGNIAATEVIANPDATGLNKTANVAKVTKTSGSEVWAGTFFETNEPINFANFPYLNIKTWSPKVGAVVKVKVENQDASITYEVDMKTTIANKWESISYDFSNAPAASYVRLVVFFDFGNAGDGSEYYFDEVSVFKPKLVQDFEGAAPTFTVFGNIAATEVIDNPDKSGLNTTTKVAKLTKSAGSEVWAGTFFQTTEALDFSTFKNISMKTWSPKSGAVIKMKLENADASITHEVDVTTSDANTWQQLVYDFSGAPTANYVRIVVFFDFGNAGDDSLYYYDEIKLTK